MLDTGFELFDDYEDDDTEVQDFLYLNDDGSVTYRSFQDVQSIIDANKIAQNDGTGGWSAGRLFKRKAEIPTNVLLMWANKYGVRYGDLIAGRYPDIMKRELSNSDNRAFRTDK